MRSRDEDRQVFPNRFEPHGKRPAGLERLSPLAVVTRRESAFLVLSAAGCWLAVRRLIESRRRRAIRRLVIAISHSQEAPRRMDSALVDRTSIEYLDQWKRLVSTTNWEKGKIICDWRDALQASGAPASEYSDEAWSRRVGNVTPQHVGRLRRAFERFGDVREDYAGLYWSHFQAALDWDDAEMWLEGAVQNQWSISEMRHERWQANGQVAADEPRDEAEQAAACG